MTREAFRQHRLTKTGHAAWGAIILSYLELNNVLEQVDLERSWYSMPDEVVEAQISVYYCPSRDRTVHLSKRAKRYGFSHPNGGALSDYAINAGDRTPWRRGDRVSNGVAYVPFGGEYFPSLREPPTDTFRNWRLMLKI